MRRMAVLLLALGGFAVGADDPPGFTQLKPSDLQSIEQQIVQKLGTQKNGIQQLKDLGTHTLMLSHMEASGQAEIHENITDVFIIQSGEATLTVGGKMVGGKSTGPGEIRGTSIEGGVTKRMGAGDIINIPAGTPHHTQLGPGQKVTYFIVKIKAK
jgi:mannose-6-phosphate isomerase-like protein (cupin superfamily)